MVDSEHLPSIFSENFGCGRGAGNSSFNVRNRWISLNVNDIWEYLRDVSLGTVRLRNTQDQRPRLPRGVVPLICEFCSYRPAFLIAWRTREKVLPRRLRERFPEFDDAVDFRHEFVHLRPQAGLHGTVATVLETAVRDSISSIGDAIRLPAGILDWKRDKWKLYTDIYFKCHVI
jgi:hypothetical protein